MPSFNKHNYPDEKTLRISRKEFERLLSGRTKEPEWQKFFAANPYVLSRSLPLRLEPQDITPLGRPGVTEPDFIFYPREFTPPPFYGVIELKRPDSKIVTLTRSNVAILSRDADTAIEQAKSFDSKVRPAIMKATNILFLGNNSYFFIIMGKTSDLISKLDNSLLDMVQNNLPKNCCILPYDFLLARFEQTLPPKFRVLVTTLDNKVKKPTDIKERLSRSIDEIEISVYSANALKKTKIRYIRDLVQMTEEEMIKTNNFSKKSINEIKELLTKLGLKLNSKIEKNNEVT